MGDAAVDQQRRMRDAFVGFAHQISSTAIDINATWPLVRIPYFELHAGQVRVQTGAEIVGFQSLIEPQDGDAYLEFVTAHYEDLAIEGHMIAHGNLDQFAPIGYTPNFTTLGPTGYFPDTVERELRMPFWHFSPRKFVLYSVMCLLLCICFRFSTVAIFHFILFVSILSNDYVLWYQLGCIFVIS